MYININTYERIPQYIFLVSGMLYRVAFIMSKKLHIFTGNFKVFHYFTAPIIISRLSDLFMHRRKLISFVSLRADKKVAGIAWDGVNEHLIAAKLMLGRYRTMPLINESSNYYNRSYKLN